MRAEEDVLNDEEADARQEEGFDSDYQGSEDAAVDEGSGSGNDYSEGDEGRRRKRRKEVPVKPPAPALDSAQTRKLRSRDTPAEDTPVHGSAAAGSGGQGRTNGAQLTAHRIEGRNRRLPLHMSSQAAVNTFSHTTAPITASQPAPNRIAPQLHPAGCSDHSHLASNGHYSTDNTHTTSNLGTNPLGSHQQAGLHHAAMDPLNAKLQTSSCVGTNHATLTTTGHAPSHNTHHHATSALLPPHNSLHSKPSTEADMQANKTIAPVAEEGGWEGPGHGDSDQEAGEGAYDDEDNYKAIEEAIPERVMSEEEIIASTAAVTAMWQLTAVVECLSIFSPWMFSQGGGSACHGCALSCVRSGKNRS